MQKNHEKEWHDHHIKEHTFKSGYMVFMNENKFMKSPGKLKIHCIRPYIIKEIMDGGTVQLCEAQ